MPVIGVRELRQNTAHVLRRVREDKVEYVVTCQGKPVAVLSPLDDQALEETVASLARPQPAGDWQEYRRVVEQIRRSLPEDHDLDVQQIMDDIRR